MMGMKRGSPALHAHPPREHAGPIPRAKRQHSQLGGETPPHRTNGMAGGVRLTAERHAQRKLFNGRIIRMPKLTLAATIVVAAITAAGCGPSHFLVRDCQSIKVLEEDPSHCEGAPPLRRSVKTHCAVIDTISGCKVGAIQVRNPNYANPSNDWAEPEFVYQRLYDWECPAGIAPPKGFRFVDFLNAPMACDESDDPLPTNPLLKPREERQLPHSPPPREISAGKPFQIADPAGGEDGS